MRVSSGDLFEYKHVDRTYYCLYDNESKYFFVDSLLIHEGCREGEFFSNLTRKDMQFIKNCDISNLSNEDKMSIVLDTRNFLREEIINTIIS